MNATIKQDSPQSITFTAELVEERGPLITELGRHFNRMEARELHSRRARIIWNYGKQAADEDETVIGLEIEGNAVVGYDGVFELPTEALHLLRLLKYDVTEVE